MRPFDKLRVITLLLDSDTSGARFILLLASLCWSVLLLLPGDGFTRPIYAPMRAIAPDYLWGLAFLFHGVSTFAASYFACRWRHFFILEGLLGLLLYAASTLSAMLAVEGVAPLFSPGLACTAAALWVFVRYPETPHGR